MPVQAQSFYVEFRARDDGTFGHSYVTLGAASSEGTQQTVVVGFVPKSADDIVPADNKRRARLNLIRHLLDSIPYKKVGMDLPKIPKAQPRPKGATEGLGAGQTIPSHF